MANQQFLVLSSTLLGGLVAYKVWKSQSSVAKSPLPPSPTSYPIIGHLLSMPKEFEHLGFMELGQQLGTNIFSLSVFGMTIIVLNDVEDAVNLLEKRSAKYSDRTKPPMIAEPSLLDWGNFATMIGYNDRLRKYRRLMNPWLHKKAAVQFQPTQTHNARLFLQRLVDKPHDFESLKSEVYKAFASTILSSIYGYEVKSLEDPFLVDAREALHNGERALVASNFAVNLLPVLVYVPEWFPGTEWKQKAREWRIQKNRAVQGIFQWTKELIGGVAVVGRNWVGEEILIISWGTEDALIPIQFPPPIKLNLPPWLKHKFLAGQI
ncbi:cytochrome P450 [Ceratobasidium sp. AG-I]|nr:cytochrome P450 [Ceratobasidium sp. AG-I]